MYINKFLRYLAWFGLITALTIIFEGIATLASAKWFAAQPVAISIGLAMICIVMMRWGWLAALAAAAGGFDCAAIGDAYDDERAKWHLNTFGELNDIA